MPCLKPRPGDSDGGYSVMDYRAIDPALGTMAEFEAVTAACRAQGMSVCVDLVLNHTAKEHAWAQAARAGDPAFLDYYLTFADDSLPQGIRAQPRRGVPRERARQLHLLPRHGPLGLDHLQRASVGPELGQSAGLPRDGRGDAVPRQPRRRHPALRRGGLHVEADGHPLPVRARGPHAAPGAARRLPHRRPRGDPSRGGDRLARRDDPLSRPRRAYRPAKATSPTTTR